MKHAIDFTDPQVISNLIATMIAKTPVAYIVLDRNFRVHFINDNFLELRKLQREKVMGQFCYSLSNNGVPCAVCAVRDAIISGEKTCVLRYDILPDGSERYIDDYAIPLYKEDGKSFDFILEIMHNRTIEMKLRNSSKDLLYNILKTLANILDKKDAYTSTHSADVSAISIKLAKFANLPEDAVHEISIAALLHDIGKIYTPDAVLNKTSRLTDEEYNLIKQHPSNTGRLLENLPTFSLVRDLGLHHHERWDGMGYPDGLAKEDIPLGARLLAIADTYDAMTSDRSYRKGLPHEVAIAEIQKCAGTQFDPQLAAQFVRMGTEVIVGRPGMIASHASALDDYQKKDKLKQISRVIKQHEEMQPAGNSTALHDFIPAQAFAEQIFKNTPAFYTVISEAFDVLFVSDSIAAALSCTVGDLLGKKCFEINNKNMSCFKPDEHGCIACPTVRAFHTRETQYGKIVEQLGGKNLYMDIIAVPVDLHDKNHNTVRCVMEILFDRTVEVETQQAMEHDIATLIQMLRGLAASVDSGITRNSEAIQNACQSFNEYLYRVATELYPAAEHQGNSK